MRLAAGSQHQSFGDVPPPVRTEVERLFKSDFADRDQPFNGSDMLNGTPQRRWLRGYQVGDRWIVWYEHGGRGYHRHMIGIRYRSGDATAVADPFARYTGVNDADLCAASTAYLSGAKTSVDL